MTPTIMDLVARLSNPADPMGSTQSMADMCREAASALQGLQEENERRRKLIDDAELALMQAVNRYQSVAQAEIGKGPIPRVADAHAFAEQVLCAIASERSRATREGAGVSGPVRIQLSRAKGWRMPENTVVVSRPSKWGNPFDWRSWLENAPRDALPYAIDRELWAKEQATQEFRDALESGEIVLPVRELHGKNLACWCNGPRFSCHADVLLELANPAPAPHRKGE